MDRELGKKSGVLISLEVLGKEPSEQTVSKESSSAGRSNCRNKSKEGDLAGVEGIEGIAPQEHKIVAGCSGSLSVGNLDGSESDCWQQSQGVSGLEQQHCESSEAHDRLEHC